MQMPAGVAKAGGLPQLTSPNGAVQLRAEGLLARSRPFRDIDESTPRTWDMEQQRWQWLPMGLVIAAVVAVCAAAGINYAVLGWWQALIYAGCIAALAAVFLFRRKLSATEVELESLQSRLAADEQRLNEQRQQLDQFRRTVEDELTGQARRLDKREQALADRLVTYREWMEFPQPLELSQSAQVDELSELAAKDRELMKLLKAETRLLYDNIVQNR